MVVALTLAGAAALAGCDEFFAEPSHRATRAVESPWDKSSAEGEVTAPPSGAVPLVSVNFANKKDESPTVTTILDPLRKAPAAATQPGGSASAQPVAAATQPAVSTQAPMVVVEKRNAEDQVSIAMDAEGGAIVTVTTRPPAGGLTLERAGESWPTALHFYFEHPGSKAFTNLDGFSALEILSAEDPTRTVQLKTAVIKGEGRADVRVPGFSRSARITVQWVEKF